MNVIQQSIWLDQHGRVKRKLRISVTDRCNFNCIYCMPEHPEWIKKQQILSFEALYLFCEFMVHRGIQQIRITGGEPLMRQGIVHFISRLQTLKKHGLKRIAMTSNAHYLTDYASQLKLAGLDDLNISLDSLEPTQFKALTGHAIAPVLKGIAAAQAAGLKVKINTVLIQGRNEDQIVPLAKWSIKNNVELRFIEYMPLDGKGQWSSQDVVTEQQILSQLSQHFHLSHAAEQHAEPARPYWIDGHPIGIISTISHSFCGQCDRLRLNAKGEFFNCLFASQGIALAQPIQALASAQFQRSHPDLSHPEHSHPSFMTLKSAAAQSHDLDMHSNSSAMTAAQTDLQQRLLDYIWHKKTGFHEIYSDTAKSHAAAGAMPRAAATPSLKSARKISMYMIGG